MYVYIYRYIQWGAGYRALLKSDFGLGCLEAALQCQHLPVPVVLSESITIRLIQASAFTLSFSAIICERQQVTSPWSICFSRHRYRLGASFE